MISPAVTKNPIIRTVDDLPNENYVAPMRVLRETLLIREALQSLSDSLEA